MVFLLLIIIIILIIVHVIVRIEVGVLIIHNWLLVHLGILNLLLCRMINLLNFALFGFRGSPAHK